jgi:hypothetical protein
MFLSTLTFATSDPAHAYDPLEITFHNSQDQLWDYTFQQQLRNQPNWQAFLAEHGTWYVAFNEEAQKPHRAFGAPIPINGSTPLEQAKNFIDNELGSFGLSSDNLELFASPSTKKHEWLNFHQVHEGVTVLNSKVVIKIANGNVIMFGADAFDNIDVDTTPTLSAFGATAAASADMTNEIVSVEMMGDTKILAVPTYRSHDDHLVYEVMVNTMGEFNIPANYYTILDAHDGTILYRQNMVSHSGCETECKKKGDDKKEVKTMGMPAAIDIEGQVVGTVYPLSLISNQEILGMPNMSVTIGGSEYFTDENGNMNFPVNGPVNANFELSGLWSHVYTDGVTPDFTMQVQDGDNTISFDGDANIKELSAYRSVNVVHDHCNAIMPESFTGMDFSLTTNIDITGTCNAFYDGSSINFFNEGGGCNATSLIADVVYHEYGHGINDYYYQSIGSFWINGAMGEGYADYWGITISDNPNLGQGFTVGDENGIRRYDIDPKVYPQDLIGEVHADGEIIMGAWYDTHLLMGADWSLTDDLFVQAYAGLQATAFNGDEGSAYVDVLIDLLQADDDDDDITNGTPNGDEIIEGFAIHGITLLSNAVFNHNEVDFSAENEDIDINAVLILDFPFDGYLDQGNLYYSLNAESDWTNSALDNNSGNLWTAAIPGQPAGTVIEYYLTLEDIFGNTSSVQPIGAADIDANLPWYILVGVTEIATHNSDTTEDFGEWDTGVSGDNATTGTWELNIPIGSFSEPGDFSTVVAPYYEHTGGAIGEFCFITGQSPSPDGGIGENDVDGGHTTLRSPVIDLSSYEAPVFEYWRWFVNGPAGGANPGTDWWQVQVSDDAGNNWTYLENTRTQDISWRRKAFRIEDYVDVTSEFQIQLIASDSTFIGQNLDGGSLIEAAVDDIVLYDLSVPDNVTENDFSLDLNLYPNPATDNLFIEFELGLATRASIEITDMAGRSVYEEDFGELYRGNQRKTIPIKSLTEGVYLMQVRLGDQVKTETFTVID